VPGSQTVNLCLCAGLAGTGLLLYAGCHQEQQAVDLYVDAVMLKELGEHEMAIEKLERAVESNKRFPLAYSMLGETYEQTKDNEKSALYYEKAIELNPWSFKDHFNLGRVYRNMNRFEQAGKAYGRACELDPDHLQAHISAARCYLQIQDYDRAIRCAGRAAQIDPNASEAQAFLGEIYASQKDYDRAVAAYKHALRIDTNSPALMISLAAVYLKAGRYAEAKDLLTLVTQMQPGNAAAYRSLGHCCLKLDDADAAIESYRRAIFLDGRDWEARRALGVGYMLKSLRTGDRQLRSRAIEQWRLSLSIEPNQPQRETLSELVKTYSR
jgi:tetratricopeptide (TPR) repeat protein